jgi:uncharacterized protein
MEYDMKPISPGDAFPFACTTALPCFGDCCRDLNQALTPYDVFRLKKGLGLSSGDFFVRYAEVHTGPESRLPVVTLRPAPGPGRKCPFNSPEGCRVYPDRPASCRAYPLARVVSRSRTSGRISEKYLIVREAHCLGFGNGGEKTVIEWIATQGLTPYNIENDRFLDVISAGNRRSDMIDPALSNRIFTLLYLFEAEDERTLRTRVEAVVRLLNPD